MSLTPARAIAAAAIIAAYPDPMPHWAGIAADLREWANQHDAPTPETEEADD